MVDNVFRVLGVQDREDAVSNTLAYCINNSTAFAQSFMSAISKDPTGYDEIRAYSRRWISGSGVPDIVLKARSGDQCDLIIIENKLKAEEGDDQTERYAKAECVRSLKEKLINEAPTGAYRNTRYIFLTLFPDQEPRSKKFEHLTYADLLESFNTFNCAENPLADQLSCDLFSIISAFYKCAETDPDGSVIDHLVADEGLDGSFLYFSRFLEEIQYPGDLEIQEMSRRSWSGRKCYLSVISKKAWHVNDPDKGLPFTIHIEPQFDCLYYWFSIFVHYELGPYKPEKEARKRFSPLEIDHYLEVRKQFESYMEDKMPSTFVSGGGWNQIGKMRLMIAPGVTLKDFQLLLIKVITELQQAIDGYFVGESR